MANENITLLQINTYGMGQGDEALGLQLIENYLKLIIQENALPKIITFYNGGVKLVATGSPVIDLLKEIEQKDVKLLACKTCLNHYGLLEKIAVGMAGTMIDIILLQKEATKVITL